MTMPGNGPHLDDRELLRLHDGELSLGAARRARKHLETCWACRYRARELRATVFAFVEACDAETAATAPPEGMAERLRRRLDEQAEAHRQRRGRWRAWPARIGALLPPRALTACATILGLLAVSIHEQLLPAARAEEILRSAERSETDQVGRVASAVVHQRLRLESGGRDARCELWRTASGAESRSTCEGDAQLKAELAEIYAVNAWDASRPASPAALLAWRAGAPPALAELARDERQDRITIRYRVLPWAGAARRGAIREASITLASRTLHALAQSLLVRGGEGEREIRFHEESYDVVPYHRTPFAGHPAAPAPPPPPAPAAPTPALPVIAQATEEDLENAEAQLRATLHQLGADTRLTPEIVRQEGRIALRLLVDTEAEQRTLAQAVSGIPLVKVEVWTPENAPVSFRPGAAPGAAAETPRRLYRTSAARADELARCLGSSEAAAGLAEQTQRAIRRAIVPALALRRLADRYAGARYEAVPAPSRAMLDRIARDYLAATGEQAAQLGASLAPVLRRCGIVSPGGPAAASATVTEWRAAAPRIERQIRELDAVFNQLFATRESAYEPVAPADAAGRLARLAEELSGLKPPAPPR